MLKSISSLKNLVCLLSRGLLDYLNDRKKSKIIYIWIQKILIQIQT